jgi:hypothetical protein
MESPAQSRVAAGRSRARSAKTALGAGALTAFALAALLARAAHASHTAGSGSSSQGLSTPQSLLRALRQSSSDDFGSGQIAPPTSNQTPQVGTGTS